MREKEAEKAEGEWEEEEARASQRGGRGKATGTGGISDKEQLQQLKMTGTRRRGSPEEARSDHKEQEINKRQPQEGCGWDEGGQADEDTNSKDRGQTASWAHRERGGAGGGKGSHLATGCWSRLVCLSGSSALDAYSGCVCPRKLCSRSPCISERRKENDLSRQQHQHQQQHHKQQANKRHCHIHKQTQPLALLALPLLLLCFGADSWGRVEPPPKVIIGFSSMSCADSALRGNV